MAKHHWGTLADDLPLSNGKKKMIKNWLLTSHCARAVPFPRFFSLSLVESRAFGSGTGVIVKGRKSGR